MLKREDGFTLIEMLIVLMIITVLILLIVPNLSNKTASVHEQGCEALKETVQAQVSAYALHEGSPPTSLEDLVDKGYIYKDQKKCKSKDKEFILNSKTGEVSLP